MPIRITASFRLEWTEAPGSEPEKTPVMPQEASKYTSSVSIEPGYCPKCRKRTAFSADYETSAALPHTWACQKCGFLWEHDGTYIEDAPEEASEADEEAVATSHGPMMPYYCPKCSGHRAYSHDYDKELALPHAWNCPTCGERWKHEGTYIDSHAATRPAFIEPAPKKPADGWWPRPCPACGKTTTVCTNTTAPHGAPRKWRCHECRHKFTVSDGWE